MAQGVLIIDVSDTVVDVVEKSSCHGHAAAVAVVAVVLSRSQARRKRDGRRFLFVNHAMPSDGETKTGNRGGDRGRSEQSPR